MQKTISELQSRDAKPNLSLEIRNQSDQNTKETIKPRNQEDESINKQREPTFSILNPDVKTDVMKQIYPLRHCPRKS